MIRVEGTQYIGKMPDVVVQAPIKIVSAQSGICGGCGHTIHYMNNQTAVCPFCVAKQINANQTSDQWR